MKKLNANAGLRPAALLAALSLLLNLLAACAGGGSAPEGSPLPGEVTGGQPQGLFFMTRYWMATHSLEKAAYYFAPNGQVYQNPTGFTAAALAATPARQRGSYTLDGKSLTVKWADGNTSTSELEKGDSGFNWDMGIFVGVKPFASADQLTGTFEGGNSVSFGGGGIATAITLTLKPDGTYAQSGAVTGSATSAESTARVGNTSSGGGKWQLQAWVLTLTPSSGSASSGVAFPVERDEKTGQVVRFYFDNVAYKRQ